MQVILNTLYKEISSEKAQDYDLVKSVGDTVFKELLFNFKEPRALILKLRGVGQFFMRHERLKEWLKSREDFFFNPENEYAKKTIELDEEEFNNRFRKLLILYRRSQDYDRFLEKKRAIRVIRNKTQTLIPKTPEDDS